MATELQRRKIRRVFRALDANGDGLVEAGDFDRLTERWAQLSGAAPGSAEWERLESIIMGWWQVLLAMNADVPDDMLTLENLLTSNDLLARTSGAVDTIAEIAFDLVDTDVDGRISGAEYGTLVEIWLGRTRSVDSAFARLDGDGDGYLTRTEFVEMWREFWFGDNADHPGTWLFGTFELPRPATAGKRASEAGRHH